MKDYAGKEFPKEVTILETLCHRGIVSFEKLTDDLILIQEECDNNYLVYATKDEVRQLAKELEELAK